MLYRSFFFACMLALLLVLSGCGGQSDESSDAATADSAATASPAALISVSDIAESAIRGNAEQALASLPPAEQVDRRPRQNRHDSTQVDTLRTLYYNGLFIRVYDVSSSDKALIQHMEVTSRDFATEEGITVGTSRAEVEQKLGQPDKKEGNTYVYNLGTEAPNQLHIPFENNKVSRLSWSFHVD
ncbi:MAG TPA: hypothetical protein VKP65_22905 [Rhodothermales bacterium]|nr:hypothetical protein [Rhodothermales bacterium]